MEFIDIDKLHQMSGLRLVIVRETPSPWSQAAKALIEYKGLDFAIGSQIIGGDNTELVAWSHQNSGPVVAWNDERPRSHWLEILNLLERIAPDPPLEPADPMERAMMIGLSREICDELGVGWNLRLRLFKPAMDSGEPPEVIQRMGMKYRYNDRDAELANGRLVKSFDALHGVLKKQLDAGHDYFMGADVTALDFYWAAFCNIADCPGDDQVPLSPEWRAVFGPLDASVESALSAELRAHRDRMMQRFFKIPMEL